MEPITIVGGGLAGLVTAIEAAEAGAPVRLLEARRRLGGRAASTPEPYVANLGPHALYTGPLWDWLRRRNLHRPARMPTSPAIWFRWQGQRRRIPRELVRSLRLPWREAPVDMPFHAWVTDVADEQTATAVSNLAAVVSFDHDPGRLSAAFVAHRIRRVLLQFPPVARYVGGGWGALVGRLEQHARSLGVRIETEARVETLDELGGGPVVLAVEPRAARSLLHDPSLRPESPRVLLYDVVLERRRGDAYLVFDLDGAIFVNNPTAVIAGLAPRKHEMVQVVLGLRPGEDRSGGRERIEEVLDLFFAGWRDRKVWDRVAVMEESTGALDLPGHTWEDRPPVAYGENVWLAGDWVAAPGHLAEVSWASAVEAARAAVGAATAQLV